MNKKKKFVIIGGPTADNLVTIFQLQHKECIMEPPFATLRVKDNDSQDKNPEIDLAFYPTKIEYLDDSGQRFGIAGYVACISTDKGYRESMSVVYAYDGQYYSKNGIGLFSVDRESYEESDFKQQFEEEVDKRKRLKTPDVFTEIA